LQHSEKLKNRILTILQGNSLNPAESSIAQQWAKKHDWSVEYAGSLLAELKRGIEETLHKI